MRETIPEDLKSKCTFCDGTGIKERVGYSSAGEMDAGGESRKILRTCEACKGKTWVWALDEQEMAERIAKAEARNKVLEEALQIAAKECLNPEGTFGEAMKRAKLVEKWIDAALREDRCGRRTKRE